MELDVVPKRTKIVNTNVDIFIYICMYLRIRFGNYVIEHQEVTRGRLVSFVRGFCVLTVE